MRKSLFIATIVAGLISTEGQGHAHNRVVEFGKDLFRKIARKPSPQTYEKLKEQNSSFVSPNGGIRPSKQLALIWKQGNDNLEALNRLKIGNRQEYMNRLRGESPKPSFEDFCSPLTKVEQGRITLNLFLSDESFQPVNRQIVEAKDAVEISLGIELLTPINELSRLRPQQPSEEMTNQDISRVSENFKHTIHEDNRPLFTQETLTKASKKLGLLKFNSAAAYDATYLLNLQFLCSDWDVKGITAKKLEADNEVQETSETSEAQETSREETHPVRFKRIQNFWKSQEAH